MKGIIFNLFEDFIISKFGEEFYENILATSNTGSLNPFDIVGPGSYPDEAFHTLIGKAAEKANTDTMEILRDMGRHSLPMLAKRYPQFFRDYNHPREFLKTASMIHHVEVRKLYRNAEVPNFFVEDHGDDHMSLIYHSKRNLCHLAEGLLAGLGDYYRIPMDIMQSECIQTGGKACKFILKFHEKK